MQSSTAVMRTLAVVAIIAFTIWTVTDAEKVSPCCVAVSRKRVVEPIKSFRLQPRKLPCVKAVILVTERGQFCIDPREGWVQKKIEEFRNSQKMVSPTSMSTNTTSSASQNSTVSY